MNFLVVSRDNWFDQNCLPHNLSSVWVVVHLVWTFHITIIESMVYLRCEFICVLFVANFSVLRQLTWITFRSNTWAMNFLVMSRNNCFETKLFATLLICMWDDLAFVCDNLLGSATTVKRAWQSLFRKYWFNSHIYKEPAW